MDDGSSVPLVKVLREGHKVVVLSLNLGHCKGGGGWVSCGGVENKGYIFERTNFNCLNNMTSNVFLKVFCFSVLYLDRNSNTYFFIPLSMALKARNSSEILQEQANSQDILSLAAKINNVK